MFNRCKHQWKIVGTDYHPGMGRGGKIHDATEEIFQQAMLGATTVSLRCEHCGDVKARLITGKWKED